MSWLYVPGGPDSEEEGRLPADLQLTVGVFMSLTESTDGIQGRQTGLLLPGPPQPDTLRLEDGQHGLHLLLAHPVVELERPDQVTVCLAGRTWETEEAAVHTGLLMSQLEESVRRESLVVTGCPDSEQAALLLVVGGDTAVLTERVATALRSIQFSSYSGLVHLSLKGFLESIKLI